jgi:hypothetical protein
MYDLETLSAREEIKELKARYFRFTDTHDFENFGALFTEDAVFEAGDFGMPLAVAAKGRAAIVAQTRALSEGATKIHHGHNYEICLHTPDMASGIWSVEYLFFDKSSPTPRCTRHAFVYYYEDYRRQDGEWRIASVRLVTVLTLVAPETR